MIKTPQYFEPEVGEALALAGNLESMKYLYEKAPGCLTVSSSFNPLESCGMLIQATIGGHIHVLEWLRANGYKTGFDLCTHAAKANQLEVMKWLKSEHKVYLENVLYGGVVRHIIIQAIGMCRKPGHTIHVFDSKSANFIHQEIPTYRCEPLTCTRAIPMLKWLRGIGETNGQLMRASVRLETTI
jgi:hypothetical protein